MSENRPEKPVTIYVLSVVVFMGLAAQFMAAWGAFDLVSASPFHSIMAALLIETAAVVEALTFARSRTWPSLVGLVISLIVSGIYNYLQASSHGGDVHPVALLALAVGPLAALVSAGLALGEEFGQYEEWLQAWETQQAQVARVTDRQRAQEQARQAQEQARREAEERAWQRQLEQQRLENELNEQKLARRRRERWERKQVVIGHDRTRPDTGDHVSGHDRTRPVTWPDREAFLADVSDNPTLLSNLTGQDIAAAADVSDRTGRRWLEMAQELAGVQIGKNGKVGL